MKKSVILMAGLLAMALAGSAQAATMFAVQNAGAQDMTTISDTGDITTAGKYFQGAANIPLGAGPAMTAPAGAFHVAGEGNTVPSGAFLVQHAATESAPGTWSAGVAPNFSFYRINKNAAGVYSLPAANAALGYFNFGTINTAVDPTLSRKNVAQFFVKVEGTWTSITDTPTYFAWSNAATGSANTEKMRLSSAGNLGIGTTAPASKLHVVGLPVFADNAAALAGGLTAGAFYRTATGVLMVAF